MGIGIFPAGIDNGDFPDLSVYSGDYFAFECHNFKMPASSETLVTPDQAAFHRADYRSMRKIGRAEERIALVWQQDTTEIVRYRAQISMLILLP